MLAYSQAAEAMLQMLQHRTGFALWMLTQRDDRGLLTVIERTESAYGIENGDVLPSVGSYCEEMLSSGRPLVIPDTHARGDTPRALQLPVGAYIGIPVRNPDGSLFGSLCGIDPLAAPSSIADDAQFFRSVGAALSTLLELESTTLAAQAQAHTLMAAATHDSLTGLLNRRGWDEAVACADAFCARHDCDATVIAIDLDDLKETNDARGHAAGDLLLQRTARAITRAVRATDVTARIGGDEFLVLAHAPVNSTEGRRLHERLLTTLAHEGVCASLGSATRIDSGSVAAAWQVADVRMYAQKRRQTVR